MADLMEEDSMESSSELSDDELQRDFASGKLQVGLNRVQTQTKTRAPYNNIPGMKQKLEQIAQELDWIERMDITVTREQEDKDESLKTAATSTLTSEKSLHDDFQREMKFYKQAQATVNEALPKLNKLGIATKRPEDYFAEMVKTDDHMQRVRAKLLSKQQAMERSEKAKKQREMKKYGKKVQQEVLQKRQKEKKEMMEAVKSYKKRGKNTPISSALTEGGDDFQIQAEKDSSTKNKGKVIKRGKNAKRKRKDAKFGFGGVKKGMKRNSSQSFSDTSSFNSAKHSKAPRAKTGHAGKKRKNVRPGKSRRKQMKK
ncbi:putative rRNA-processing protein EBP2 isoform X2 [Oculina patagonica]